MSDRNFVHLHCHSHYSLLDGASPIGKLITRAKEHGMNALALTDHGNLHGALEFYRKAKEAEINPIIGYELGAKIAKTAYAEKRRVKDVAAELTDLSPDELDRLLDPADLAEGGIKGGGGGGGD